MLSSQKKKKKKKKKKEVTRLLHNGTNPCEVDANGSTPLHYGPEPEPLTSNLLTLYPPVPIIIYNLNAILNPDLNPFSITPPPSYPQTPIPIPRLHIKLLS